MTHAVRFASFLIFVGLLLSIGVSTSQEARRHRVNGFLVYFLLLSAAAGFAQKDDWPFSPYRIFHDYKVPGGLAYQISFRVLGSSGRECRIDPEFASPVILPNLGVWFERTYPRLTPDEQARVMAFLMGKVREAGQETPGRPAGRGESGLAWLSAPPHWGLYALPRAEDFARCLPYTGLRVYRETWRPSETVRGPIRVSRDLLAEYRAS